MKPTRIFKFTVFPNNDDFSMNPHETIIYSVDAKITFWKEIKIFGSDVNLIYPRNKIKHFEAWAL